MAIARIDFSDGGNRTAGGGLAPIGWAWVVCIRMGPDTSAAGNDMYTLNLRPEGGFKVFLS